MKKRALKAVAAGMFASALVHLPPTAGAATFNMLSCCPGEDTATEARIVWHSDDASCTLRYAKASSPDDYSTVKTLMAAANNGNDALGAIWFSVTPEKMTMHYFCESASDCDSAETCVKDRGKTNKEGMIQ